MGIVIVIVQGYWWKVKNGRRKRVGNKQVALATPVQTETIPTIISQTDVKKALSLLYYSARHKQLNEVSHHPLQEL